MALRGLTVAADGSLRYDGKRFRNIGLNYPSAIIRLYDQPSATACAYTPAAEQDAVLDQCVSVGAKVLRVKAFPLWPAQWRYGVNGGVAGVAATAGDREAHYVAIDNFLAKCEARGIGVILDFFFRIASVPDLAGQTIRAGWLTSGSATRTYAHAVTQELVTRYLTREGVLGYEFANEVNHYNDASDATRGGYPSPDVAYGTPASYSAVNDIFNGAEFATVLAWWYEVVRAIDPQRIVLTGNGPCSYSLPGGAAGIPTPLNNFYWEQVRDNPTNCGSIHFYGNIACTSANFRGLSAVLSGAKKWQAAQGRGFVLGEFGNQPWSITGATAAGGVLSLTVAASCPIEPGDRFRIERTGTALDGQWYSVETINPARTQITAPCPVELSWTGSVKGFQFLSPARLERMCADIIAAGVDVALMWMIDSDALRPALESVSDPGNAAQLRVIRDANARLAALPPE
jgi:hypothetical protein